MKMYLPPKDGDLTEIKIEVTRKCPLSCIHCSSGSNAEQTDELSTKTVVSLIQQAKEMGVSSVAFSGGEPLVWPGIQEAIAACTTSQLESTIYTTGNVFIGDGADALTSLANAGLSKIICSLYSPIQEYHEQVALKSNSYATTIRTLALPLGIKKEIHFVPLTRNLSHLEDLIRLATDVGVERVSVLRLVPQGRGIMLKGSREMLSREDNKVLRAIIQKCRSAHPSVTIRLGSPYNILLLDDVECIAARNTLSIGPSGDLFPCDAFKSVLPSEVDVANTYNNIKTNTLRECWERSPYLNAIRHFLTTPFESPCEECTQKKLCKSGCLAQKVLARASIMNGRIMKLPDPLCMLGN